MASTSDDDDTDSSYDISDASPWVRALRQVFAVPVDRLGDVAPQLLGLMAPVAAAAAATRVAAAQPARQGSAPPQNAAACFAPGVSARDNTYLNRYYGPAAAGAAQYGVNPAFILGNGYESGFGTSNIYNGTGDAFGMSNGTPDRGKQRHAVSRQDDVNQLLDLYGRQIQGSGNNQQAYINGLHGRTQSGQKIAGGRDYNSKNSDFDTNIGNGIGQMRRDLPLWLKYCGAPSS